MQNSVQPFINFVHANIDSFSRFSKSPEIAEVTKVGFEKYFEFVQETLQRVSHSEAFIEEYMEAMQYNLILLQRVSRSEAFIEWTQASLDNYVRFVNEVTGSTFGAIAQGQEFLNRQAEESGRRLKQVVDSGADATNKVVIAGENVASVKESRMSKLSERDQTIKDEADATVREDERQAGIEKRRNRQ